MALAVITGLTQEVKGILLLNTKVYVTFLPRYLLYDRERKIKVGYVN